MYVVVLTMLQSTHHTTRAKIENGLYESSETVNTTWYKEKYVTAKLGLPSLNLLTDGISWRTRPEHW